MKRTPLILSKYILGKVNGAGALKLQKLLYYSQAYFLAVHNKPLFNDDFEAWVDGPVIPSVYGCFKEESRFSGILRSAEVIKEEELELDDAELNTLNEVIAHFSRMTGSWLSDLTHKERPWIQTRTGLSTTEASNRKINKDLIRQVYREEISKKNTEFHKAMKQKTLSQIREKIKSKYRETWIELAK